MTLRSRARPLAKRALKGAATAADRLSRSTGGITILIYHRIGAGAGGEMDVDPGTFDAQLAWLTEHHRVLSLDQAAAELATGTDVRPGVVLTFDDGTADWVDHALPALVRHGVPATFYVATDFVERQVALPHGGAPVTWAGLAEMASSPLVRIGSHTHRHQLLDRLAVEEIAEELDRSIELLGERVGVDAQHFCYPKAVPGSPAAEAAVKERFATAVLAGTRANVAGADLYRLRRSPVQRSDGQLHFQRKAAGGMHLEDDLRAAANRLRYRRSTS